MIALTLETNWWLNHGTVIKPEYFGENEAETTLVKAIHKFCHKYNRPPQQDELETYITALELKAERKQECLELAKQVCNNDWDLSYARDNVLEFARIQALKLAMLEAIDRIDEGDIDNIDRLISTALETGAEADNSINLIKDVDTWLSAVAYEEKIPTGIFHVDVMLEGGASRGEVGVILGPPNYGKSMSLVNIGAGAAGLVSRARVEHVTLEISEEKIAKRYAARTTFGWYNRTQKTDDYKVKFLSDAKRRIGGPIVITGGPPGTVSADDLRRMLDRSMRASEPVDCLIIDYADEMKLPRGENSFERHGLNYRQLKHIAREYDIVVWTASQTNRSSLRKLTIDLDDIAESFQKAARADIILTWCQTPEEEDDGEMRLFCAKNRDGIKHWYVKCKLHNDAHAIISQEILWGSDLVRKKKEPL